MENNRGWGGGVPRLGQRLSKGLHRGDWVWIKKYFLEEPRHFFSLLTKKSLMARIGKLSRKDGCGLEANEYSPLRDIMINCTGKIKKGVKLSSESDAYLSSRLR